MQLTDHALIGEAARIPTSSPTPVLSFSPVVLPCPDRRVDLQLRVSVPSTGDALPIILLSHGHGLSNYLSSLEGYTPLADFWAGHGFAVIQPTHLSSKSLGLALGADSIRELFLESRALDMTRILDRLDEIEAAVPLLKGRLDRSRVAVAGHSLGALTASVLLGATNTDPRDGTKTQLAEKRIKAGVVIGGTGAAGQDLSDNGRVMLPFYGIDFSGMRTPALVVWGDEDVGPHLTVRGADWHADPYTLAPGAKESFMVKGGKHGFGGISGWDAKETLDESPERLAAVQRMTLAYLKSQLYEGDKSWPEACKALAGLEALGKVEGKST
ncbi:Alpha/beta-hydrolase [Pleurostoma richardsiae]|uniref:1-alkyl-2-acetylglycerophosphocholine esterase n=1 Tax=Pleurostoma richardsiae TaxID=41990 RepID=A0AA38RYF0_9PEZI|nr:Alpha/beta-hydrolase [Pleurostoma richardsiae]